MARVLAFFSATVVAGMVGRATFLSDVQVVLISPLAGVGYLWLASGSRRSWRWDVPALSLAQALVVVLAQGPPNQIVMGLALALVQPVVTVVLMRRWAPTLWGSGGRMALSSTRDLAIFVLACAIGAAAASAVRGAGLGLLPPLDAAGWFMVWLRGLCGVIGIGTIGLMITPSITRLRGVASPLNVRSWLPRSDERLLEAVTIYLATLALYAVTAKAPVVFALVLVTVWAGFRLSPVAATIHAMTSGSLGLLLTLNEVRIFADSPDRIQGAAVAQGFMIVLVITGASVSLATRARDAATQRAVLSERESIGRADLLTAVLEHMHAGVVVLHADGTEPIRNPAGRSILGLTPGRPYDETMPGPDFGIFDARGRRYPADELPHALALSGIDTPERDYFVRTPRNPEGIVLEITGTHIPGPGPGEPDRAIINFQDVTLERLERDALASFAGVVAHDLNTPLSSVIGWAGMLRERFDDGPVDPAHGFQALDRVDRAAHHMRQLIMDLLAFTVAKDQPLQLSDVNLGEVVESVSALRHAEHDQARVDVQPGLVVRADLGLMRQLVDNLVSNAVKYVAPGVVPHVRISGEWVDGQFLLSVVDNGVGVPVDMRRRIFENFQRAHGTTYPGTGIGLAICRRIVERHGGSISVHDNGPHPGSRFLIALPADPSLRSDAETPSAVSRLRYPPAMPNEPGAGARRKSVTNLPRAGTGPSGSGPSAVASSDSANLLSTSED